MGVTTRIRDRGCFEEKSNSPVFCVEVPWCSGSTTPIAYSNITVNGTAPLPPRRTINIDPRYFAATDTPTATNLKFGSSSALGNITFNFASIKISQVVVNAYK